MFLFGNPGIAVGDVNGDGLDDLYVCQEAGLPNRLFIQNRDGSARDQSASWGVDWLESSRSALLVDLDNDGDQDLVVAILGGVVVAENDGQGRFQLRDVLPTNDDTMSLSAVDYDMDGRLDLYVCAYDRNRHLGSLDDVALPGAAPGFVVHDANNGGNNSLFRNQISADGTWRFTDVTRDVGLDVNNHRWSLAAAWDDFDNDGDQDLYVANDYGRDNLYRNDMTGSGTAGLSTFQKPPTLKTPPPACRLRVATTTATDGWTSLLATCILPQAIGLPSRASLGRTLREKSKDASSGWLEAIRCCGIWAIPARRDLKTAAPGRDRNGTLGMGFTLR